MCIFYLFSVITYSAVVENTYSIIVSDEQDGCFLSLQVKISSN